MQHYVLGETVSKYVPISVWFFGQRQQRIVVGSCSSCDDIIATGESDEIRVIQGHNTSGHACCKSTIRLIRFIWKGKRRQTVNWLYTLFQTSIMICRLPSSSPDCTCHAHFLCTEGVSASLLCSLSWSYLQINLIKWSCKTMLVYNLSLDLCLVMFPCCKILANTETYFSCRTVVSPTLLSQPTLLLFWDHIMTLI